LAGLGLRELPAEVLWHGSRLMRLDLGGNELTRLPVTVSGLVQLTALRLGMNQLAHLPLAELRGLVGLAELCLGGNPVVAGCAQPDAHTRADVLALLEWLTPRALVEVGASCEAEQGVRGLPRAHFKSKHEMLTRQQHSQKAVAPVVEAAGTVEDIPETASVPEVPADLAHDELAAAAELQCAAARACSAAHTAAEGDEAALPEPAQEVRAAAQDVPAPAALDALLAALWQQPPAPPPRAALLPGPDSCSVVRARPQTQSRYVHKKRMVV